MRHLLRFLCALFVLNVASVASARVAIIQTTARLSDHSETSLQQAVKKTVATAVRGALAMELSQVALQGISQVDDETVAVQVLASDVDSEPGQSPERGQSTEPDSGSSEKREI